jgi:hypothetical protein
MAQAVEKRTGRPQLQRGCDANIIPAALAALTAQPSIQGGAHSEALRDQDGQIAGHFDRCRP